MVYLISFFLIALSALFSGLTLGLLSLNTQALKRQARLGSKEAATVYPIRKQGNLLLTTLLLGNVAVNTSLSIFLGSIASGVVAGIVATASIFLLGEIIPQAVISRHALWFGNKTAPLVRILIFISYPITFPIAYLLDKFLGEELPTIYSKHELMEIISEHEDSEHSNIDQDEKRILHGALQFSHTKVEEVMTLLSKVVMFADNQRLSELFLQKVNDEGYSRYPVYKNSRSNIIGILYTKDLITEENDVAISQTRDAFVEGNLLSTKQNEFLDIVLTRMLKQKKHMAIVFDSNKKSVGVITLEDILEEIIQHEIEDEDD
jgi:metal transporter CNNM